MKISGFQKLTLLDFPGLVACTVFIGGCNFRCPFCHNSGIVTSLPSEEFSQEEILSYIRKRKGVIDGVCVSGGEPLAADGVLEFLRKIKAEGVKVKLDTNGSFPERLRKAVSEGLVDYVAMDVKNTFEKYSLTCGVSVDIDKIRESISFLASGEVPYEFRTTVVRELHSKEDVLNMAKSLSGASKWYLQQFIDSGNLIGSGLSAYSPSELEDLLSEAKKFVSTAALRGV